jgi:very-long-chain (3R)-3-hydroxyacyl-CoA dehydratase
VSFSSSNVSIFNRYTAFIALYVIGVTGEQLCCFAALPYYREKRPFSIPLPNVANVTFDSYWFLIVVMLNYIPCESVKRVIY